MPREDLSRARVAAGKTQHEVALALGLKSSTTVSHWERGVYTPTDDHVRELAELYGCGWEPAKPARLKRKR